MARKDLYVSRRGCGQNSESKFKQTHNDGEKLPAELVRDYLGGAGFGIKCLYGEVKAGTPALGED